MKKEILNTIKKLAVISPAFILKNDKITSLTTDKTVCAIYEPDGLTEFEIDTPIFNMNEFLNVVDLLGGESAVIDASEDIMTIKNGRQKTRYLKSESEYVKEVPESFEAMVEDMDSIYTFNLTQDIFETITKMGSLLGLTEVRIESDGTKVFIKVLDKDNESNSHLIELVDVCDEEFVRTLSLEKFVLLGRGDYNVDILDGPVVGFDSLNVQGSLRYFIAPLSE